MKTSNCLLMGLLSAILLALIGSTFALKAQHDSIDYNDLFYGYTQEPVAGFSVLCIEGLGHERRPTGVNPSDQSYFRALPPDRYTTLGLHGGRTFQLRVLKGTKVPYTLHPRGDTLLIRFEAQFYPETLKGEAPFTRQPFAYIIAPAVHSLVVKGATCIVSHLTGSDFTISSTDARVLLRHSRISRLSATSQQGSLLQTAASNHLQRALLVGRDSAAFVFDRDVFGALALRLDSTTTLKASASVFRKVKAAL